MGHQKWIDEHEAQILPTKRERIKNLIYRIPGGYKLAAFWRRIHRDVEMRDLISGTCAQALNSNYELIEAITCGFRKLNGPEVQLVTVTQLEKQSRWKPHLTLLMVG